LAKYLKLNISISSSTKEHTTKLLYQQYEVHLYTKISINANPEAG